MASRTVASARLKQTMIRRIAGHRSDWPAPSLGRALAGLGCRAMCLPILPSRLPTASQGAVVMWYPMTALMEALVSVQFSEAGPCSCRWPLWYNQTEPRLVCGEPVEPDRPYCREHVLRSRHRTARATPWKAKPNRVALIRQIALERAERQVIAASPQPKPPPQPTSPGLIPSRPSTAF